MATNEKTPPNRKRNQPWASGPAEILQHGINLLQKDTDTNRRLAMLSIDNAVELMIKTYLGLPKRVTGLQISRSDFAEINESFPKLLDALENHVGDKLDGIDLGEIDWYHRLRNELYHQGNGLTVERNKVVVYAELAQLLFLRLFGFAIQVEKPDQTEIVGNFVTAWANLYQVLEAVARDRFPERDFRGSSAIIPEMAEHGLLDRETIQEIQTLRALRNKVVHGDISGLTPDSVARLNELTFLVQKKIKNQT
jgi:hypothetical protein